MKIVTEGEVRKYPILKLGFGIEDDGIVQNWYEHSNVKRGTTKRSKFSKFPSGTESKGHTSRTR